MSETAGSLVSKARQAAGEDETQTVMAEASDVASPHSGTLTFADGEHSAWVEVIAYDDTIPEPDETVTVQLSTGAVGTTLIYDNDGPGGGSETGSVVGNPVDHDPLYCTCPLGDQGASSYVQHQTGAVVAQVAPVSSTGFGIG